MSHRNRRRHERLGRAFLKTVACALVAMIANVPGAIAAVQDVTLVSKAEPAVPGATAAGTSQPESVSADGRYVVFTSTATNVVPGHIDTNELPDVFLHDRVTGTTALVSHASGAPGTAANSASFTAAISADGAYVVFLSTATNLVPGIDANGGPEYVINEPDQFEPTNADIFLYERATGTVTLVTHVPGAPATTGNRGAGTSYRPSISADGAFVAYASAAMDLLPTGPTAGTNVFLYSRATDTNTLVNHVPGAPGTSGNSYAWKPVVSADGAFVAFASAATNLVVGTDANGRDDIFLYERATGVVRLVSHVPGSETTAGNGSSEWPLISADGGVVVFTSRARNLVTGPDTGGVSNVFAYERATGTVELISHVDGAPSIPAYLGGDEPAMSADGRFVTFVSFSQDVAPGAGSNGRISDVFSHAMIIVSSAMVSSS